jgi:hypothetical protein
VSGISSVLAAEVKIITRIALKTETTTIETQAISKSKPFDSGAEEREISGISSFLAAKVKLITRIALRARTPNIEAQIMPNTKTTCPMPATVYRTLRIKPVPKLGLTNKITVNIIKIAMKEYFTKGRRDLIARTFSTLVQIAVGGAIAGNIFTKLTTAVKVVAIFSIISLFILAVIVCPKRSDE